MVVQLGMRLFDPVHGDAIERLRPWLDTTSTGDRAELDHEPPAGAWAEVAAHCTRDEHGCHFVGQSGKVSS
jgi:hypothetical protein